MPLYTFHGINHDRSMPLMEFRDCADEAAAVRTARALARGWPRCALVEISRGDHLIGSVRIASAAHPGRAAPPSGYGLA